MKTPEQCAAMLKALGLLQSLQLGLAALVAGARFPEAEFREAGFPDRAHLEALLLRLHADLGRQLSLALPSDEPLVGLSPHPKG